MNEASPAVERAPINLEPRIDQKLIVVKGRSGISFQDFKPQVVENQAGFGRTTADYVSMVVAHRNTVPDYKILGIHQEKRRRCLVQTDGGEQVEFEEANPLKVNVWVGEHVKMYTSEEAAVIEYAGSSALKWATVDGQTPEMVVKASDGLFYPANRNDIIMSDKKPAPLN